MFELPSIWNLIISTVVFFVAVGYARHYLEMHGIPKGITRGTLIFILASCVSWGAGAVVDWAQAKVEGPKPVAHATGDVLQLLKQAQQTQL